MSRGSAIVGVFSEVGGIGLNTQLPVLTCVHRKRPVFAKNCRNVSHGSTIVGVFSEMGGIGLNTQLPVKACVNLRFVDLEAEQYLARTRFTAGGSGSEVARRMGNDGRDRRATASFE